MAVQRAEITPPLEAETVAEFPVTITHGKVIREVAAVAIMEPDGKHPVIRLGKRLRVGFISGGEAILRDSNSSDVQIVKVEPDDVAIVPDVNGSRPILSVYRLAEEPSRPESAGVDDAAEGRE